MVKAVFAGSFDPPTNGHLDIIKRASGLFESVDVVVSVNPEKKTMFSEEERVAFLKELIKPFKNVSVHSYKGIVVNYAKEVGAKVLVRGVRSANDFGYEFELALMNQNLNPDPTRHQSPVEHPQVSDSANIAKKHKWEQTPFLLFFS